jgi:hypothetical protein
VGGARPALTLLRPVHRLVTGILALATIPSLVHAQELNAPVFTISGGPSFFRLPELGHGTGLAISGTQDRMIAGPLGWQLNLTSWTVTEHVQAGAITARETHSALFPEIGLTVQPRWPTVRPFVSAGLGATLSLGRIKSGAALYAAGGLRWRLANRLNARTELRLRSIRPFAGHTWEATLGLSRVW